jgi:hypothetical protein
MKYLALLAFAVTLYAQPVPVLPPGTASSTFSAIPAVRTVRVTISQQASMAQTLSGLPVTGYSATMCSADGLSMSIGGGLPWQVAERGGLQLLNLHVASVAATQTRAKSGLEQLSLVGAEVLFEVGVGGALNLVKVNPAKLIGKIWRAVPVIGAHEMTVFNTERAMTQPNVISVFGSDMLDPSQLYVIPSGMGVCLQKLLVASPHGPVNVQGEIQVP